MTALTHADWQAVWLSAKVACTATIVALPFAFAAAYALAFARLPWKPLWDGLVKLPLVLPPVVVGYLLLLTFGSGGLLGPLLNALHLHVLFTWRAAVLASVVVGFPLLVQAIHGSLEDIDHRLIDVARTLGASWRDRLLTIVLPLAKRGVLTGMAMMFARSLGEFGATVIVAGNIPGRTQTIPLAIYDHTNSPGGEQAALGLCLLAVALSYGVLLLNEGLGRARRRRP